jgi:hypothetical protein
MPKVNRVNAGNINSSPFKGEAGRGMGMNRRIANVSPAVDPIPSPALPLKGRGFTLHAIAPRRLYG